MRYDPARTCPKCGGHAGTFYVDPNISHSLRASRNAGKMKRVCQTCGYSWFEEPLDEKADAEEPKP